VGDLLRVCVVVPYDLAEEGGVKRHALRVAEELRCVGDGVTVIGPLQRRVAIPPPGERWES
jgi:hypothetical protein